MSRLRSNALLLLVSLALSACDLFSSSSGQRRLGEGELCEKDRDELTQLLVQPQDCVDSSTCPTGSHCSAELGSCDWQCFVDSDCGAGRTCSCDGRCVDGTTPPPTGQAGDPSCPRDRALLVGLDSEPRTCALDEDCPYGSRCDAATGHCEATCLGTDDALRPCSGGAVCDCRGECVMPGDATPPTATGAFRLDVSRDLIVVEGTAWPAQQFQVTVHAPDAARAADPSSHPVVRLTASPGLALSGAGSPAGPTLALTSWSFTSTPNGSVATVTITVTRTAAISLADRPWEIQITGEGIDRRRSVLLGESLRPTPPSPPLQGRYRGVVARIDEVRGSARGLVEAQMLVWADSDFAVFFDDRKTLSQGGRFGFSLTSSATQRLRWLGASTAPGGEMLADVALAQAPTRNAAGDLLGGRFTVTLPFTPPRKLTYAFDLYRERDLAPAICASSAQCAADSYCEVGLAACVEGAEWRVTGVTTQNKLADPAAQAWVDGASWFFGSYVESLTREPLESGVRGFGAALYCHRPTVASFAAPRLEIGDPLLAGPAVPPALHSGEVTSNHDLCGWPIPIAIARDRQVRGLGASTDAGALLDACLTELAATPPSVPWHYTPAQKEAAWFGTGSACVSLAHTYPLLHWLTGGLEVQRPARHRSGVDARVLQRVVASFTSTLAFVARQGREALELDRALLAGQIGDPSVPLADLLDQLERGFATVLRPRVADALTLLPRTLLRRPDYRRHPAVAYYTFDIEDMNYQTVHDLAAENHLTLAYSYARSGQAITTTQNVTIPRGAAELNGTFTVAFWLQVPPVVNGEVKPILEYGDNNNLLYIYYVQGNASNQPVLYGYHGPRSTRTGATALATLTAGTTVHLHLGRLAYWAESGGVPYFYNYYSAAVNGTLTAYYQSVGQTIAKTLDPASARGTLYLRGYVDELAFWEQDLIWYLRGSYLQDRSVDNKLLDVVDVATKLPVVADHEQDVGPSVALVETAAEYLGAAGAYLDQLAPEAYGECWDGAPSDTRARALERHGRALRWAAALEALADDLYMRARERGCSSYVQCPTNATCGLGQNNENVCMIAGVPMVTAVPWADRYLDAKEELDAGRARLHELIAPIEECRNPLGIPEDGLPLFFGDVLGTSSRFFAASDYLLDTWARPSVAQAEGALEVARDAWLAKRNSEIQELQTQHEKAARLESLTLEYARPLIEMCGLEGTDGTDVLARFADGRLNSSSCFRVDSPQCATPEGMRTAECFRGELGTAMLAVAGVEDDVRIAQANAAAATDRYEAASQFCSEEQAHANEDIDAIEKHHRRMQALRRKRQTASFFGSALSGMVNMLVNPVEGFAGWVSFIASAPAAGYAQDMEQAEANFQTHMQIRSIEAGIRRCFFEADQYKYGIDAAYLEIGRRLVDVEQAVLRVTTLQARVRQLAAEGNAALARETGRATPSVAHHYWLDERVTRFEREFAWAKRLTYLAMRAVEYEFQQSLGLRDEILAARDPEALAQAILVLQQERAGRTINGSRPEDSVVVLSLRDDILGLADRSFSPRVGERDWEPDRRFAERLRSREFAYYASDGTYLGQGIPFRMKETGALAYRCAERLWRVGATVQGDAVEVETPNVPMIVFKRNTFMSQWCDGKGDGDAYQTASVRPTAELFRPGSDAGAEGSTQAYSSALIYPWFNVIRSELYRDAYAEGASDELAGRGLYGDYILLFPESGLLELTDDDPTNDFPLERIEDVLIRFDLLSVDDVDR